MKVCSKCRQQKQFKEFYKNKARYDGYCNYCKVCDKVQRGCKKKAKDRYNKWRFSDKGKKYFHDYYKKNKDIYAKRNKKWSEENRDRIRELWRNHTKSNEWKQKHKHNQAKRRFLKNKGKLLGFEKEIQTIYKNCPKNYHVDHIVPLKNKIVCGLHVPWNLQYLPAHDNLRKNNRLLEE